MPKSVPYPFPGMDPWMQGRWGDVHNSLASKARDYLNRVLPDDLYAQAEERIVRDVDRREGARLDVTVRRDDRAVDEGGVAVAEPTLDARRVRFAVEQITEPYLQIFDEADRLVTSIEWISPTDKRVTSSRNRLRRKRRELLAGGVNTFEADLTRGGRRDLMFAPAVAPGDPINDGYAAMLCRGDQPGVADLYHFGLRDRLPVLPVPLRQDDPLVTLDLQALIEETWRTGRNWKTRYDRPCEPALSAGDRAWAEGLIAAWRESA